MRRIMMTGTAALWMAVSLSACANTSGTTGQEGVRRESIQQSGPRESTQRESTQQSGQQESTQWESTQQSERQESTQQSGPVLPDEESMNRLLSDKYLDIAGLPMLDIGIEDHYVFEDRTLELEDSIDNEVELLAFHYYYYSTSGEFEKLKDLIGDKESLQIAVANEQSQFQDGIYKSEYTIHGLTAWTAEDLQHMSESSKTELFHLIQTYDLDEYAVVRAEVGWKHNEASLSRSPQLGDGDYTRYFLVAKTRESKSFKIYEVYWEDMGKMT